MCITEACQSLFKYVGGYSQATACACSDEKLLWNPSPRFKGKARILHLHFMTDSGCFQSELVPCSRWREAGSLGWRVLRWLRTLGRYLLLSPADYITASVQALGRGWIVTHFLQLLRLGKRAFKKCSSVLFVNFQETSAYPLWTCVRCETQYWGVKYVDLVHEEDADFSSSPTPWPQNQLPSLGLNHPFSCLSQKSGMWPLLFCDSAILQDRLAFVCRRRNELCIAPLQWLNSTLIAQKFYFKTI